MGWWWRRPSRSSYNIYAIRDLLFFLNIFAGVLPKHFCRCSSYSIFAGVLPTAFLQVLFLNIFAGSSYNIFAAVTCLTIGNQCKKYEQNI